MKKLFAVVIVLTALSLSACAGNSESYQTEQSIIHTDKSEDSSISVGTSENVSAEENKPYFDKLQIKPEITMDGQYISLPCKVKNIAGIRIDTEYSFVVVPETEEVKEYSAAYFYYNNKRAGLIRLDGSCSGKTDLSEETVVGLDVFADVPFSFCGLSAETDKSDIIKKLGKPDIDGDTILNYYIDGNPADHIDIDLNSSGKIKAVRIYLGLA